MRILGSAIPTSEGCYVFQMRCCNTKDYLTIKVAIYVLGKKKN